MKTFTVARTAADRYAITSNIPMSDGSMLADGLCCLEGNVLRSHEQKGVIRVGGLLKLKLGVAALFAVEQLAVGQSQTFNVTA